jgi:hypothetical protein
MKVIEAGHTYELASIDGGDPLTLTFVKRHDQENPDRFPGNTNSHPGTTLQNVLRACHDRVCFLQQQIPCDENIAILNNIQNSLYLLEHRAARRHGLNAASLTIYQATHGEMCKTCGHVMCECKV